MTTKIVSFPGHERNAETRVESAEAPPLGHQPPRLALCEVTGTGPDLRVIRVVGELSLTAPQTFDTMWKTCGKPVDNCTPQAPQGDHARYIPRARARGDDVSEICGVPEEEKSNTTHLRQAAGICQGKKLLEPETAGFKISGPNGRRPVSHEIDLVWAEYLTASGRTHDAMTLTPGRVKVIHAAICAHGTQRVIHATRAACADGWLKGGNPQRRRYDYPESFLRPEKITRWLEAQLPEDLDERIDRIFEEHDREREARGEAGS
jgi:hypothetical protein